MTGTAAADGVGRWSRLAAWAGAAALWLAPMAAMQVTAEVNWTSFDFVVWGAMLLLAAGGYDLASRRARSWSYRAGAVVAIGAAFLLVWVSLAVGVIGDEGNPANLMFAGVLGVGVVGATIARLRPLGMSRAMACMALAQALAIVVTLTAGMDRAVLLTSLWVAAWLGSAWLFLKASREPSAAAAS